MGVFAGKYDRVITIQSPNHTAQGNGESKITSWSDVIVNLAACLVNSNVGGKENVESSQRVNETDIQFQVRYLNTVSINSTMQVVYEGSTYGIGEIKETGKDKRTELTITCYTKDN